MLIEEAIEIMNNFIKDTPKMPYECLMNKEVEAVETLLNYIDIMHKEFDRLEGIEDNTAMLKQELKQKDKVFKEIEEEIRSHIRFENRLKRDNIEPDLFNQGRFYVADNIKNILQESK